MLTDDSQKITIKWGRTGVDDPEFCCDSDCDLAQVMGRVTHWTGCQFGWDLGGTPGPMCKGPGTYIMSWTKEAEQKPQASNVEEPS